MIGFKVVNEWNDFEPVYYCGDCLDTSTGVEGLSAGDTRTCHYCNAELGSEGVEEAWSTDEVGAVEYAPGYVFVNVYEVDRCWGGREEGGWWYDAGQLITSRQVTEESAEDMKLSLQIKYKRTGDSSSVIYSGGDYRVWIEDHPGADFPEYKPHYE